ncbi:protein O-linked-mannose beta-1,2-N-acetylglucosaminyltransferase 1-like [Macrobrachium nipponense]|uniref:protein O-linked-mannose beta-1,2-N-acetylglucosaminyltransferase 1-like n=1 Tax=Macrobrachium nipponense TaxID=159736 RepID=UPI0030C7F275
MLIARLRFVFIGILVPTSLCSISYSFAALTGHRNRKRLQIASWSGLRGWAFSSQVCEASSQSKDAFNDCTQGLHSKWEDSSSTPDQDEDKDDNEDDDEDDDEEEEEEDDTAPEGITLSVINERNGRLLLREIFPLTNYWAYWIDLQWNVKRIAPGRVVVMSVSRSGCKGLRQAAQHLARMGSLFAEHLTPSAHWIWVFIKGGQTLSETTVIEGSDNTYIETQLVLKQKQFHPNIADSLEKERWHFCDNEDGLGELCDETSPAPLPVPLQPKLSLTSVDPLESVPVIITAGKRFRYLCYTLMRILAAPGVHPENLLVVLGDTSRQTLKVLHLLNINHITLPTHGTGNTKLFHYYRDVFAFIAKTYNDSQNVIMMDEDVEVSPDFFSFMSQTLWLLQHDPSVYCINGHGKHKTISHDIHKVLRGRSMVAWGYALSVTFVKEALKSWLNVAEDVQDFYDLWLYQHVANGRDCIFPDVSRTKHYGIGINTVPFQTESFFQAIPLVEESGVLLTNTSRLTLPLWKHDLTESIKGAKVLTGNPCSETFIPTPATPTTYVIYVNMTKTSDGWPDCWNYYKLLKCLGAWDLTPFSTSPHGLHEGVATFMLSPNATVHAVGVPYSSYSYLRHPSITPWRATPTEGEYEMFTAGFAFPGSIEEIKNRNMTSETLLKQLTWA